ncbi:MAG: adenosylmethionine--8-amino-7-oxononanoate transaminase [Planctomycetota bacterium]
MRIVPQPGTRTAHLIDADFRHVWHPFTPARRWRASEPAIIESADAFRLRDTEGRQYIDGVSSLWCNVHGHRHREIDDAVRAQLDRVAHSTMLGLSNVPAIEFAEALVSEMPGELRAPETKVLYSDSGSEALEAAFKIAVGHHFHRGETQRDTIVGIHGAYHGDTVGAMSVGYQDYMHKPFERMVFRVARSMQPDVCRCDEPSDAAHAKDWPSWDCMRRERVRDAALADLDRVLDRIGDRCAAIVLEPLVQGAAGMIEQPHGFLAGVAERARERGLLLIADEVAVGFGRTGTMFACEQEGVSPDILCAAKGITAGYLPLAATVCRGELAESFEGEPHEHKTLYHGHTYTGNPLACAAALASLGLFRTDDVLARVNDHAGLITRRLRDGIGEHPHIGDVRQRGMMVGVELVRSREPWVAFDPSARTGDAICAAARTRGLFIRPLGDVVILMPAPGMDTQTLEEMLSIVVETIRGFDFDSVPEMR